jgi:hypothetical protein
MDKFARMEKKRGSRHFLYTAISVVTVAALLVAFFITPLNFLKGNNAAKDILKSLFGSKSDLKGELASKNLLGSDNPVNNIESQTPGNDETPSSQQDSNLASSNPSNESSWLASSRRATSSSSGSDVGVSSPGILRVVNAITPYHTSSAYKLIHWDGSSENVDSLDKTYFAMPNPSGITTKIISKIDSTELYADFRPLNSKSTAYLELSIISSSGGSKALESINELRLELPRVSEGYDFENKTLTIQQYDPSDSSASYSSYDVRDVIDNDNGVITLANLNGTYTSGVPYAYFKVMVG